MLSERFMISETQWQLIEPHCSGRRTDHGRNVSAARLFMEAVLWIAQTGTPWRDLPAEFGKWNSVFSRFRYWVKRGVFHCMFKDLFSDSDFEYTMIDGTICKVHRHGQGTKGERRNRPLENPGVGWPLKFWLWPTLLVIWLTFNWCLDRRMILWKPVNYWRVLAVKVYWRARPLMPTGFKNYWLHGA